MFDFIYLLRILAAVLITNSHYEEVYPVAMLANGGLLGDVIFFAVSGYCLFPVRHTFLKWYGRRLKRIYPFVWIITIVYLLLGFYQANTVRGYIRLLAYPTYYHFAASILVLYIVYFFAAGILQSEKNSFDHAFGLIVAALLLAFAVLYCTVYDRSYYHIDTVREPMIAFLYFFAMLTVLWFRKHKEQYLGNRKTWPWIASLVLFCLYFASKLAFSRGMISSDFQILNQVVLLLLLCCLFRGFIGLEDVLHRMPEKLHGVMVYTAGFAFEIYLVQYALIDRLNIGPFPVNFLLVSGAIILSAWLLHMVHDLVVGKAERLFMKR